MKLNKTLTALIASASLGLSGQAMALGTTSGTPITNTATLDFKVNSLDQAQVSDDAVFNVATLVNFTLTKSQSDLTDITAGAEGVLEFKVSNLGNTAFDFDLTIAEMTGGDVYAAGTTDNSSVASFKVYEDTDDSLDFNATNDSEVTYLDEVAANGEQTFFIVATALNQPVDLDIAGFNITVDALTGGTATTKGGVIVATAGAFVAEPATPQIVIQEDQRTDKDGIKYTTAIMAITKNVTVTSDPINLAVSPKAIPGATVQYTLSITNTGSGKANTVVITDDLDDLDGNGSPDNHFDISTISFTEGTDVDVSGLAIQTISSSVTSGVLSVTFTEIAAGESATITFEVDLDDGI